MTAIRIRISDNAQFVTFISDASNLVTGDTNTVADIFVYDRTGDTIERVSESSGGAESNAFSANPAISGNGRFVAFQSTATNLVAGDVNGWRTDFDQ